jgi:Dihydrodipicolinate synthase/N-acetylneuraminate lyase
VPNLTGLKVSDTPFEAVKPYLVEGLDVFIGFEPLVLEGLAAGAVGAVSGLASAWPEVTAELVHRKSDAAAARVNALRDALHDLSLPAVAKQVLVDKVCWLIPTSGRRSVGSPTTNESASPPCELRSIFRGRVRRWMEGQDRHSRSNRP